MKFLIEFWLSFVVLSSDGSGNIFFNDCLFACMKKAYGANMVKEGEL